jgi:hypothetical protein
MPEVTVHGSVFEPASNTHCDKLSNVLVTSQLQETLLVRGFVNRGFAYSRKNYCGNICASRCRSLALAQARGVTQQLASARLSQ